MTIASVHDVAAELRQRLPGIGNKKLHKLLYYCQGHHLATFGVPLFPETISAWDMGPVVGVLWKRESEGDVPRDLTGTLGEAELNTVGYVISRYGGLTGSDLERLTHSEDPWMAANNGRAPKASAKIPVPSILSFFAAQSDRDGDEDAPMPDASELVDFLAGAESRLAEAANTDSLEELRARLAARA